MRPHTLIRCDYRVVEQVIFIARLAGKEIMRVYNGDINYINLYKKLDQSPVTSADLFSNRLIIYELQNLTPNIPIISEEQIPNWQECKKWNYFWLIDPLDGTKEFLSRNGEFTVNIALIEHGEPILGVIYVPVYNIVYIANNNQVWKINSQGERFKISTKMSANPVILVSRNHHVLKDQKKLRNYLINMKNYKVINIGSSFKFCLIAEGFAQFYPRFSSTKIWDTAAGHAIAKAAGALVNDWQGYPLNYKNINKYFLNPGFQVSSC